MAIDLKDPGEREFVEALVRWADVLVENFRPGVMDRLGLADDRLAELNPRLIRLAISGFGERGPDRDRVGYDQILQAEGGVMSLTGTAAGRAVKVGVPIADVSAGLFGVIGVLGALVEREHSGLGQRVSTSLLAGQVGIHTFQATRYLIAGQVPGVSGNHHPDGRALRRVRRRGWPAGHRGGQRGHLAALRPAGRARPRGRPVRHQRAAAGQPRPSCSRS